MIKTMVISVTKTICISAIGKTTIQITQGNVNVKHKLCVCARYTTYRTTLQNNTNDWQRNTNNYILFQRKFMKSKVILFCAARRSISVKNVATLHRTETKVW